MKKQFLIFGLLLCYFSCSQRTEQAKVLYNEIAETIPVNPAELPPPIKAKYIDPDSIAPPIVVPLRGQPKVVPAHRNEHPVGKPRVFKVPMDLLTITLGKDVPLPTTIPANGKIVPALHPKPKPIKAFRSKDAAIYNIQFLSEEQGIYTNVKCMLEDSRGHLWFGNSGYLARYDGINFFVYSEKEGFLRDAIDIMEDSKGNIWFAGAGGVAKAGGLCYYDGVNVVHFDTETGLESNESRALMEDSKGNIWFANGTKGVYCYNGKNFTVFNEQQRLSNDSRKEQAFYSDNRIVEIEEDSKGQIWWATQGSGVLRYDPDSPDSYRGGGQITHFTEKEGLVYNYISEILEDNDGHIWFGSGGTATIGKGVSRYNPLDGINGSFSNFTKEEGLSGNRITGMAKDNAGKIWLAFYDGGLTRYDSDAYSPDGPGSPPDSYRSFPASQGSFTHFTLEEGLSFQSTLCIMIDRKDNIWVGTNGGGVSRFQPNSFRHFTEQQGLSKNWANPRIEDHQGNIWMSSYLGGAIKYDGKNFTHYTEKEGLLQNIVNAILEDSKGNLWFAYRDKGISRFDGKNFYHYTPEQGLSFHFVWDLHEDKQGNIWVACGWQGGMTRINPNNGQITHFTGDESDGIGGSGIMEDSQQNLWFGGRGWIAKFDAAHDELIFPYNIDPAEKEWVELLVEDNQENLWFGTSSSFVQVKKNGNEIKNDLPRLTVGNGLPDTKIASLIVDKSQNIWIGGADDGLAVLQNGLDLFGRLDAPWLYFYKEDGLKSNYFSYGGLLDSKNKLWLGSVNGITQLNLNRYHLPKEAPQNLELSFIELQGQFLDYRNLKNEKYQSTLSFGATASQSFDSVAAFNNYPQNLQLPYDLNHLTFHFTAIDWAAPHRILYSYRMKGLDKSWSQPQPEAKADYRSLPYGSYNFEVKAIGEAQVWTEPISYPFIIHPPWWHSWWAYALYALLTIGTIGWYVQRLRRKIRQKQEQLEREQSLNTQLANANEQLENISVANSRFVPTAFLKILHKESILDLKLGDQTEATMTILFADIRNYTGLSEKISPEDNFKFINGFLGRMGPIIEAHGGFISQYLGDGIMALFKENPERAVSAAIEMQKTLQRYNKQRFVRNRQPIQVGIGLNTGKLMLGVIGDQNRYESSVISDAVNTASRMEGLTKIFGCSVIISEKTLAEIEATVVEENKLRTDPDGQVGKSPLITNYRYLGKVKVKGKDQALRIYDFYGGDPERTRALKTRTKAVFEQAIHFYYNRKFGKAADLFKLIAKKFPEDIATEYYMGKAVKYIMDGVAEDWSGAEEMMHK